MADGGLACSFSCHSVSSTSNGARPESSVDGTADDVGDGTASEELLAGGEDRRSRGAGAAGHGTHERAEKRTKVRRGGTSEPGRAAGGVADVWQRVHDNMGASRLKWSRVAYSDLAEVD